MGKLGKCVDRNTNKEYEYLFDSHSDGNGGLDETYYVSRHDFDLSSKYGVKEFNEKFEITE